MTTTRTPSMGDLAAAQSREKQRRRTRHIKLGLVFLGCVLLFDAVFGERGFLQTLKSRQELLRARQVLSELKRQNAVLRADARRLEIDPATLELVARQELGLIRRGEILVVLSDIK